MTLQQQFVASTVEVMPDELTPPFVWPLAGPLGLALLGAIAIVSLG